MVILPTDFRILFTNYNIITYFFKLASCSLQLPMQSVPITIKVVSSDPVYGKVYLIKYYTIIDFGIGCYLGLSTWKNVIFTEPQLR
jgi:hypothetical protein